MASGGKLLMMPVLARRLAAAAVRRARNARGLTQAQAAAEVGLSERSYRDIELGRVRMAALEALLILQSLGEQQAPVAQLVAAPVPNPADASSILVGGLPQETTKRRAA